MLTEQLVTCICILLAHSPQKNGESWGWGQGGEMNQALYAHMNNKRKMKKKKKNGESWQPY
jgi:hypothetical protein